MGMGLINNLLSKLSETEMRVGDAITEYRLGLFKPFNGLLENISLPDGFDKDRIKIFWPSIYGWGLEHKWFIPLLSEFRRNFDVELKPIPYYENALIFEIQIDDQTYPIAIDRFDKTEINEKCISKVAVYFKMQFSSQGYAQENVLPGGFIPAHSSVYLNLQSLRDLRAQCNFRYDSYGRFGNRFAKTIRGQAMGKLTNQREFIHQGGMGRVRYQRSLAEVAQSKVCVDLPGNGPLCFRLIDYFAVGSCIVAYPHQANFPVPLVPGKHIVYCKEDLSDLIELCHYYATHDDERETIASNARTYFDEHLCRPRLASYYINSILAQTQNVTYTSQSQE